MENFINKSGVLLSNNFYYITHKVNDNIYYVTDTSKHRNSHGWYYINIMTGEKFFDDNKFTFPSKHRLIPRGHCDNVYYMAYDKKSNSHIILRISPDNVSTILSWDTQLGEDCCESIADNSGIYVLYNYNGYIIMVFLMENGEKIIYDVEGYRIYCNFITDMRDYYAHPYLGVKVKNKGWNFLDNNGEFVWKGDKWFDDATLPDMGNLMQSMVGCVKYDGKYKILGKDGKLYERYSKHKEN